MSTVQKGHSAETKSPIHKTHGSENNSRCVSGGYFDGPHNCYLAKIQVIIESLNTFLLRTLLLSVPVCVCVQCDSRLSIFFLVHILCIHLTI